MMNNEAYMRLAIEAARKSAVSGGGPFGAVLVVPKVTGVHAVYIDNNHVTEHNDPTAHAEVSVIRQAAASEKNFDLSGAVLYSSCEPCPMCLAASLWARIPTVYYSADRHDAAFAGFDDLPFYELLDAKTPAHVKRLEMPESNAPFTAWLSHEARIAY